MWSTKFSCTPFRHYMATHQDCLLLAISLFRISKIDLDKDKSAKIFFSFMSLDIISLSAMWTTPRYQTECSCFHKCDFFYLQWPAILWDLEQLGLSFAFHTRTTQGMCTQNLIGCSGTMRMQEPTQRFNHRFWLQWWQGLQTYQNHVGPTLHVGSKYSLGTILYDMERQNCLKF